LPSPFARFFLPTSLETALNRIQVALYVVVIALGGSSVYLWRQHTADLRQLEELQARLNGTVAEAGFAVSTSAAQAATTHDAEVAVSSTPMVALVHEGHDATRNTSELDRTRAVSAAKSPENVERTRVLNRAMQSLRFPDAGEALGLSPEQVSRIFDLLTKQDMSRIPLVRPNGEMTDPQIVVRQAQENDAELAALLGSKLLQWKEYNRELPARIQVRDLGVVLNSTGDPLSDAQIRMLKSALISAQKQIEQLNGARFSPENTQILVNAASAYLSPEQLKAYHQMIDRQQGTESRSFFMQPRPNDSSALTTN
jgi:hypothetical protein